MVQNSRKFALCFWHRWEALTVVPQVSLHAALEYPLSSLSKRKLKLRDKGHLHFNQFFNQ